MIVAVSFIFNIIDDVVYFLMIPTRYNIHGDDFSIFIIVGKVFLHIAFLYFNGIIFYQNHIEIMHEMLTLTLN